MESVRISDTKIWNNDHVQMAQLSWHCLFLNLESKSVKFYRLEIRVRKIAVEVRARDWNISDTEVWVCKIFNLWIGVTIVIGHLLGWHYNLDAKQSFKLCKLSFICP